MFWYRLVFLLLLPLGLGGCWELSTRVSASPTAPYGQDGFTSPGEDAPPTPRFFQFERTQDPS